MNINSIIAHTNLRLKKWYENAKKDYDVAGSGVATFNEVKNEIVIDFLENDVQKRWSISNFENENIDFVFCVWMEQAN